MKILDIITEATAPISADAFALAWMQANPKQVLAYKETLGYKWGVGSSMMKFFKGTVFWAPTIEAGAKVWALEQIAKQPLEQFKQGYPEFANFSEADKAKWISQARDEIFGIWVTQYAAQGLISVVFGSASLLGSFLRAVGGAAGTAITKKPGFGSEFLMQAVKAAATWWLQSETGTRMIKEYIGPAFFNTSGAVVTTSWDWLVERIAEWTGVDINQELAPATTDAVKATVAADTTGIKWKDPARAAKDYADFEKRTRSTNMTGKAPGEL